MKVQCIVTYTEEEIKDIIKVLNLLCKMDDEDNSVCSKKLVDNADKAFLHLSELLCMDPEGEKAFEREGW